ncbi:AAEL002033-PA [Aedes aegypti]|uniref:AAEL002033-PA n=1 Tax=Aedes aegypti TaxID=7159 RepID=Q17JL2_AEDAE|nr:AAEL002033-PA [Aedes aegypti]
MQKKSGRREISPVLFHDAFKVQLYYFEKGLSEDQLTRFTMDWKNDYWYGSLDELGLFNYWKSLKDKSEGLMFTEPLQQFQSITLELTIGEDGSCTPIVQQNAVEDEINDPQPVQPNDDMSQDEEAASNDPFEGIFIWPKVNERNGNDKQRRKEHVPSVATSNRWRKWYDKKDEERKQEEEAKVARIEKRKLARIQKEEEQSIRKKKRDEKKLQKEKQQQEKENNPPRQKKKKRTLMPKSG